jgi:hypothetical protein
MAALASPDLPLKDVSSGLSFDAGRAWLEFSCDDQAYHWDMALDDAWVDAKVFDQFCHLLENRRTTRALAVCEQDQASFFVYTDATNLIRLCEVTGLTWVWLENGPTE